jgi:ABC-2 type transport system ATP-binding protein
VIEVDGLTQRYGSYTAVRELSFALEPGEIVGFLGPNGAGKTTTLKVISAFLAPSQGTVRVAGHDVQHEPLAVQRALGYLPEHCPLYEEMRVRDFLGWVARVREVEASDRAQAVDAVVARCQLEDVVGRPIAELSKGYRQRVGIAQALVHEPRVLVLDEPTHGLDPNQVLEIRSLVRELGQERTVLFSSHILSEVEATCKRVLVLHQGRLVADDTLASLAAKATGGAVRLVCAAAPEDLLERLSGLAWVTEAAAAGPGDPGVCVRPAADVDDLAARLFGWARDADLVLTELAPVQLTLEDVFAGLTGAASA